MYVDSDFRAKLQLIATFLYQIQGLKLKLFTGFSAGIPGRISRTWQIVTGYCQ